MAKARTFLLPGVTADFSKAGASAYWKQIVPQKVINYVTKSGKKATIDFSEEYLNTLIADFNEKGDNTPFVLADKDNAHTMDPERFRGVVKQLRLANDGEQPGLYGKVIFPKKQLGLAVEINPDLPVSARIREDENGRPTLVHVLGTMDPQVTGMESWQPADLSVYDEGKVIDLSNAAYSEGNAVAKKNDKVRELDSFTEAEIEAMTDEQVDEFLATYAPEFDTVDESETDEVDDEEDDETDETDADRQLVGAGAELSKRAKRDIELANSVAAAATARSNEALRRMAAAEWREYRLSMQAEGVPPHLLDLAEPVLNRADEMVIDLSNSGEEDVDVSGIIRKFIDNAKGQIDLSVENGHAGNFKNADGTDPDAELLKQWENQF